MNELIFDKKIKLIKNKFFGNAEGFPMALSLQIFMITVVLFV